MHVMRNCIDHGIEAPEVRRAAGKPEAGTIVDPRRAARQPRRHRDRGRRRGIDEQKLVRKAIERGLVDAHEARELSRREMHNLMFLPGVSTKDVADEMSGRGVGMDVVKTNIARLSGIIDVESEPGLGTRLTITLPITLAIIQALIIRAAGRTFAVPLNSVLESLRVTPERGAHHRAARGDDAARADAAAGAPREAVPARARRSRAACRTSSSWWWSGWRSIGLASSSTSCIGQEDIVIKSLGRALDDVPGIAGATELGGKKTVLVLDVAQIVEEAVGAVAAA